MTVRKIGVALAIIGLSGAGLSVLVDVFGLGDGGIQAAQILGIEAGILLALLGLGLILTRQGQILSAESLAHLKQFFTSSLDAPKFIWVGIGFLVVYVGLFLGPVFLNPELQMVYYNRYIPNTSLIGSDLRALLEYVENWLVSGGSPYADGYIAYPPLALLLYAPLILVGFPAYFRLVTFATLGCYVLVSLILPLALAKGRDKSLLLLLSVAGFFSYGLQFEIERGQSNLIAFALCFLGIYIFHKHQALRFFAYVLFVLSVQLKIYPALFVFMLVDDWRDWKATLWRFFWLGLSNFLLLFILGLDVFNDFLGATSLQQLQLTPWNGSSIRSFVFVLSQTGFGIFSGDIMAKAGANPRGFELVFLATFAVCFVLLLAHAFIYKVNGFDPYLFLASTVGVLIVPTISNDYKLPLLVPPVAILFSHWPDMDVPLKKIVSVMILIVVSGAFWLTVYPFKFKADIFVNSMPALLTILILTTILVFIAPRNGDQVIITTMSRLKR